MIFLLIHFLKCLYILVVVVVVVVVVVGSCCQISVIDCMSVSFFCYCLLLVAFEE